MNAHHETSTYTLDLPGELKRRRINPKFHVSLLRPHVPNDDLLFPGREVTAFYDFGDYIEGETGVEAILDHIWNPDLFLKVKWDDGDETWEPLSTCDKLEALDRYLELHGVRRPGQLPRGDKIVRRAVRGNA